jgi:hypothetical protein
MQNVKALKKLLQGVQKRLKTGLHSDARAKTSLAVAHSESNHKN